MKTDPEKHDAEKQVNLTQLISLVLSIYVLIALTVETLCPLSDDTVELLNDIDFLICIFFLYDFAIRFRAAKSKLQFMQWGWVDLISSIPLLPFVGWARMVRVIRILRILRAFRSTKILVQFLYQNRAQGIMSTAVIIGIVMTIFSAIAVLNFENAPNSNIKTSGDALWWAAATVTTVGPPDVYPVTPEGRTIAILLMTAGVILFAIFTAYVASQFTAVEQKKEENELQLLIREVRALRVQVANLEDLGGKSRLVREEIKPVASNGAELSPEIK